MRSSRPSRDMVWSETPALEKPNVVLPPASPSVSLTRTGQGAGQGGNSFPSQVVAIDFRHLSACSATARAASGVGASTEKFAVVALAPARKGTAAAAARAIHAGTR